MPIVFGAVAGYVSSRIQDALRQRRRLRGIAAALLADVTRIREQIGQPTDKYVESMMGRAVVTTPKIHDWVQGLIPQAAEISPALVTEYMRLERELGNFAVNVEELREAAPAVSYLKGGLKEAQERDPTNESAVADVIENLDQAQLRAHLSHDGAVTMRKDAWETMARIERLLS